MVPRNGALDLDRHRVTSELSHSLETLWCSFELVTLQCCTSDSTDRRGVEKKGGESYAAFPTMNFGLIM